MPLIQSSWAAGCLYLFHLGDRVSQTSACGLPRVKTTLRFGKVGLVPASEVGKSPFHKAVWFARFLPKIEIHDPGCIFGVELKIGTTPLAAMNGGWGVGTGVASGGIEAMLTTYTCPALVSKASPSLPKRTRFIG